MKLKVFGYILIVFAFAVGGFMKSAEINKSLKYSYAYFDLICLIRDKIALWQLPLSKIYESADITLLNSLGFTERLRKHGLNEAFQSIEKKLVFDNTHTDFCIALGTMPLSETIKLCDTEIKRLDNELNQKKVILEKKSKVYPALGILAGLAIVIMIL